MDPRLAEIARELESVRLAAELFDPEWRLVWVSSELRTLLGEDDDDRIGVGTHVLEARTNELWSASATEESQFAWNAANVPYILFETPDELLASLDLEGAFDPETDPRLQYDQEPGPAPIAWSYEIAYRRPGFQPMPISCVAFRIRDVDGEVIGTANAYAPGLPAGILDLLARGDEEMFERMAALIVPGRREAAILYADLQASGALSRRLSSAAYFGLIRDLTTAIDGAIGEFGGVVGKHAGDGVTAFFLGEFLDTRSAAAAAAIDAARAIGWAASEVAAHTEGVGEGDLLMNVGLHWSGGLYMGQVVTGGRLEVTALGDEMNECARIQQSAREGSTYASKSLVEQLDGPGAQRVGIDPDRVVYRTVAELPGADEKSIRDAGGVAVTEL